MSDALVPAAPTCRFVLRGRAAAIEAAGAAFGIALPLEPCRAASAGDRAALWLGPDEWLLLAPEAEGPTIEAALIRALGDLPHALVDVSHRAIGLRITGMDAATIISAGCPLDPEQLPVGACARTVFGKAEIVLWRTAADVFRVEVARSFAAYVTALLEQARRDWT